MNQRQIDKLNKTVGDVKQTIVEQWTSNVRKVKEIDQEYINKLYAYRMNLQLTRCEIKMTGTMADFDTFMQVKGIEEEIKRVTDYLADNFYKLTA